MRYAVLALAGTVAFQLSGFDLGTLVAAGAMFAVGIGFALQNLAQNFVSGVLLLVEQTIKPGDVLEVDGRVVRVVKLGLRTTVARTRDEEDRIIPNATLVQNTVKNHTLADPSFRLRVAVGVSYGSDMKRVRDILERVAREAPFRDAECEPLVMLTAFGSSSVDWEIGVWTTDPWAARRHSAALHEAVWFAFREAGIAIPFPQLDVHFAPPASIPST